MSVPYTRLAGFGRTRKNLLLWGSASLWLGADHLLSVKTWGFREEYRRLYFADIQAISARRTNRWIVYASVSGVLLAALVVTALALKDLPDVRAGLLGLAVVPAVVLAVNLALGPTCLTTVTTAVQTEDLGAVNRVRKLERVLERVRPLVWAAQRTPPPSVPGSG